jgi:predicted transposase/invertase (TIGR01784 family)
MKFLDPKMDWAFKRIFGSAGSRGLLRRFLNDLLHRGREVIAEVEILDPYLPSRLKLEKNSAVDVRARLADGAEVIVEMQMFPVAAFPQRVLFNGAKCLTSQLGRGQDYRRIRPVIMVTIADCVLLADTLHWRSDYTLSERKTRRTYPGGGLHCIFVELPKAELAEVPAAEPLRAWLEFLKNAPASHPKNTIL